MEINEKIIEEVKSDIEDFINHCNEINNTLLQRAIEKYVRKLKISNEEKIFSRQYLIKYYSTLSSEN